MVLQYNTQTEKLALVLKKSSLPLTVPSIHDFLFNHLQYKADGSDQMLRSPACSWYDRVNGIDCKSYTIFASCLLYNLGINHYIRKIKQPASENPNDYSHVYVIVPIDQKNGDTNKGYYVIDGTLRSNKEPFFSESKDFYMQRTKTAGLNGIGINDVKNLFSSNISCWGGTAYSKEIAEKDLSTFSTRMQGYIDRINDAVVRSDMKKLADASNMLIGDATWNASIAGYKRADKDWNSCSSANLKAVHEAFNFYRYTVCKALKVWLETYFTSFPAGYKYYGFPQVVGATNTKYYETDPADQSIKTAASPFPVINVFFDEWISYDTDFLIFGVPYFDFLTKPMTNIPKFEITKPMLDFSANPAGLTPQTILSSLSTIIVAAQTVSDTISTGTPPINPQTGQPYTEENFNEPKPDTAGGGFVGWLLFLAAIGFGLSQLKTEKQSKNKNE